MIPVIDVRNCVARKNYEGTLEFEFEADQSWNDIPYVAFSTPVKAALRYEILEDNSVEIEGSVSFSLKGACSRCLAETEQRFTGEANATFVSGKADGEEYSYFGNVDLREFLRDAVMFALPTRLLCDPCNEEE